MPTRGEIIQAKLNLRQLFLHPRAANGEADKVVEPIFDLCPGHRAVAPPAGPNDEADLCVMRHFVKNRALQLGRDSRGQREHEDFELFR